MAWVQWLSLSLLALCLAQRVFQISVQRGYFKTVYNHAPGPCRLIPGIEHGSEDIQTLPNGLAFISSGLRNIRGLRKLPAYKGVKGAIYTLDLKDTSIPPKPLHIYGDLDKKNFDPHGLSVWMNDTTDEITLFVVNHARTGDAIEKFVYQRETHNLEHLETIQLSAMTKINDVVAMSDSTFYWTNEHYFLNPKLWRLEEFAGLRWGTIGYYNGRRGKVVHSGLSTPNGINISPDRQFLYVADCYNQEFVSLAIQSDFQLKPIETYFMGTSIDNLELDPKTGDIWVGAHPKMHNFTASVFDPSLPAPSQVLRIKMSSGRVANVKEVYSDSGHTLFGSSVASYYQGKILIGTVRHKALLCEIQTF